MAFPNILKALETYLGASDFLTSMVPSYAQLVEPLQNRKLALLAEGRQAGRAVTGNHGKRQAYTRLTPFEPTKKEMQSFEELQYAPCNELGLSHMDPGRQLFLQIDGLLERDFGVMMYHLKDGRDWTKGEAIPATAINPVIFLSHCLTKAELDYCLLELEVACLFWACKRLRILLHSSNLPIIVFTGSLVDIRHLQSEQPQHELHGSRQPLACQHFNLPQRVSSRDLLCAGQTQYSA